MQARRPDRERELQWETELLRVISQGIEQRYEALTRREVEDQLAEAKRRQAMMPELTTDTITARG